MVDFERKDPLADNRRESTVHRDAYFLDFVPKLRKHVTIPIMVTGGFRSAAAMADAVANDGVDVIGLGRPFVLDPDVAHKILKRQIDILQTPDAGLVVGNGLFGPRSPISFLRDLSAWGALGWYYEQIYKLADNRDVDRSLTAFQALLAFDRTERKTARALVR